MSDSKTSAAAPKRSAAAVIASTIMTVCSDGNSNPHHVAQDVISDLFADEFAFRLNEGNVKRHTLDRLESFVLSWLSGACR